MLVVIFHEAGVVILELDDGAEAVADLGGVGVAHGVVERFVVGELETEVEELRLGAPVGFGK